MIFSKFRVSKVAELESEQRQKDSQSKAFFTLPSVLPLSSKVGWMKRTYVVWSQRGGSIFNFMKRVFRGKKELILIEFFLCASPLQCIVNMHSFLYSL